MSGNDVQTIERFTFLCLRCQRALLARNVWVDRHVYCPHCESVMRVPEIPEHGRPVRAVAPDLTEKQFFNFPCPRCDCMLEGHTGMCAQNGSCPTCGARMEVPRLRAGSRLPEKATLLEGDVDDPAPVHAYAASGFQAPEIHELDDGTALIKCPRCDAFSPIDADICRSCDTPFTMEAASTLGRVERDRRASLSVTAAVIGIPLFPLLVPAVLAAWWGAQSAMFVGPARRSAVGYVGLTLGLLELIGGSVFWYVKLM